MNTVPVVQFVFGDQPGGAAVAPRAGEPGERPFTVVYDGACRVCQRLVKMLIRWDRGRRLEILPSQAPGLHARFPWIPGRAYSESIQLVGPNGKTWQGAAAIEQIIDQMPKGRLITWVFSIPFVRPLAEKFYRWFARNRYKLGCGEHCQLRPEQLDYLGETK